MILFVIINGKVRCESYLAQPFVRVALTLVVAVFTIVQL